MQIPTLRIEPSRDMIALTGKLLRKYSIVKGDATLNSQQQNNCSVLNLRNRVRYLINIVSIPHVGQIFMDYIRVYSGNDLKNQFELGEDRVTIGRTEDNVIMLADSGVSRQHAAIEYENGDYFVVDLGSRNGVFLNKERVEKEKLKYWDEIQIHNFVIKFMAKPGLGAASGDEDEIPADLESDKTEFFNLTDEKQLDNLRQKTKQCFLTYKDQSGAMQKLFIKKPRTIIGKSKDADIKITGWLSPSVAATIERQGGTYELVPGKRGKIICQSQLISEPTKLTDGSRFIVRDMEFEFFNRLTDTD